MLTAQYGPMAEKIEAGYTVRRPVTLRANTLKTDSAAVFSALSALGISCRRAAWYPDAFILDGVRERTLEESDLFRNGEIYLQSLSSMLPPLLLAPKAGENILDMAAAPGGKTAQISALSGGGALITACEKDRFRFERLKFNLTRQGVPRATVMMADASALDDFFRFDKILLDAPCSGSGTIKPGVPVRISERLVAGSVKAQEALLEKGLRLLKPGGILVYSTCSVLRQENEELVGRVAPRAGGEILPVELPFLSELPLLARSPLGITVCPNDLFEGFFLSLIRKRTSR